MFQGVNINSKINKYFFSENRRTLNNVIIKALEVK